MPSPTPSNAGAAIAIQDVHFSYRRAPVLVGTRWEVPQGTFAAVLGLSGAGKSTLLQLLAGVLTPQSGSVTVLGSNPAQAEVRRLIGYMPQVGGLYHDLTVEENLRTFAAASGVKAAREELIEKTLEFLGLRQRRKELVGELAAGFQQRISMGIALLPQAPVLLLDEPFCHADIVFRNKALAHLKTLVGQGRTVLVATSHSALASQAQLVGVMRAGRLAVQGRPEELVPPGKAEVTLMYREKTGSRNLVQQLADYRQELPNLISGSVAKPYWVEIQPDTSQSALDRMLTEEPDGAALHSQ